MQQFELVMMRFALVLVLAGCLAAAETTSMKGWEIYSWADKRCAADPKHPGPEAVCFALLPGTNRTKSAVEIKKTPLKLAELEHQLAPLKKGEEVFWSVGEVPTSNQFDLPSQDAADPRARVVKDLARLGLKLSIVPRPANVGTITMAADGSIDVRLRSLPPGPVVETMLHLRPGDTKYQDMVDHVGGLAAGETKLLPPWP